MRKSELISFIAAVLMLIPTLLNNTEGSEESFPVEHPEFDRPSFEFIDSVIEGISEVQQTAEVQEIREVTHDIEDTLIEDGELTLAQTALDVVLKQKSLAIIYFEGAQPELYWTGAYPVSDGPLPNTYKVYRVAPLKLRYPGSENWIELGIRAGEVVRVSPLDTGALVTQRTPFEMNREEVHFVLDLLKSNAE